MRIMIVEDHDVMRDVLSSLVSAQSGLQVVGTAASAEELLDNLNQFAFDLALVDLSLPGMSGDQLIAHLLAARPDVKTLIVSGHDVKVYGRVIERVGANGYVMKDDPEEIITAIRTVARGETFVTGVA